MNRTRPTGGPAPHPTAPLPRASDVTSFCIFHLVSSTQSTNTQDVDCRRIQTALRTLYHPLLNQTITGCPRYPTLPTHVNKFFNRANSSLIFQFFGEGPGVHWLTSPSRLFLTTTDFRKVSPRRFVLRGQFITTSSNGHKTPTSTMSPSFDSPPPPPPGPGSARHAAETNADDDDSLFSKPRPRPARSSAEKQEIRTRNRRREYLERNPGYFQSSEHELAGTFFSP